MAHFTRFATVVVLGFAILQGTTASASVHTLDFRTTGAAGAALDIGLPFAFAGVTLTATATSTTGTPAVNGDSASLGVNIVNVGGEEAAQVDSATGEELTFTFSFGPNITLTMLSLDLLGVGPTSPGDDAYIYKNAGLLITLHTGVANFNGTTDVWTPPGGVSLANGDTLRFVAGTAFGIQGMTFDVQQVVPEPISVSVWLLGIAACLCRRSR